VTATPAHWHSLPVARRARLILGAIILGIAFYLVFAPKPWSVALPEAEFPPYDYYVKIYSWYGATVALCGAGLLALTASWWTRPWLQSSPPHQSAPRWFWPMVGAAMLLAAAMGSMRLGHDLWDDERTTLQRFVQGNYKTNEDGSVRFREFGFGRTLHEYRMPNNHILHSILARMSVGVWRMFRNPAGQPFSEAALRLPAFLFGIASIAAIALMLKELGMARAGVIAAFLLSIHPWHIRYASEARGYALVLCFLPLLVVCLLRALRSGAWRWWSAVGALQFGLLYAYPASLYPVAATNAVTLLLIIAGVPGRVPRALLFARWLVPVFVAALTFTWLFFPCVPQLLAYLASEGAQGTMGAWWIRDFLSHLFVGASWFKTHNLDAAQPELFAMLSFSGTRGPVVLWTSVILFGLGLGTFIWRGLLSSAVAVLLLIPAIGAYLAARASGSFLYEWYLIYLLPGAVAMVAAGIDSTGLPWRGSRWFAVTPAIVLVLLSAGYLQLTTAARDWLLTRPLQPMRESVLLTRPTTLPNYTGYAGVVTASFNTPPYLYDPHVTVIRTPDELRALMKRCEESSIPLYLNVGNPLAAAFHHPEMFAMMNDPAQFEILAQLPGYDPTLDRIVARHRQATGEPGGT
jgi:hypothetical protein